MDSKQEAQIHIRKAKQTDAGAIVPLLLMAMEEIVYKFIGEKSYEKASSFLHQMVLTNANQYSYQNCWVITLNDKVVGAANIYDGADLRKLIAPVALAIKTDFDRPFNPEDETAAGEMYVDCIGVNTDCRGLGLGSKLLSYLVHEYVDKQKKVVGLLVEDGNPQAEKLYLRLGFKQVGTKTLVGKNLKHLQIQPQ